MEKADINFKKNFQIHYLKCDKHYEKIIAGCYDNKEAKPRLGLEKFFKGKCLWVEICEYAEE